MYWFYWCSLKCYVIKCLLGRYKVHVSIVETTLGENGFYIGFYIGIYIIYSRRCYCCCCSCCCCYRFIFLFCVFIIEAKSMVSPTWMNCLSWNKHLVCIKCDGKRCFATQFTLYVPWTPHILFRFHCCLFAAFFFCYFYYYADSLSTASPLSLIFVIRCHFILGNFGFRFQ